MNKRRNFSREFKLVAVKKVLETGLSTAEVARDLGVSQNSILNWKRRFEADRTINLNHQPSHDTYGSPRMYQELQKAGVTCRENTVAKLMRRQGIRAKVARKFKVQTTDSKHDLPIAPNRLNQNFQVEKLNQVWLADFTFIQPKEGVIVHSDRGSQFASLLFQNRLRKYRCLPSMSRKGNRYDNAPMESFFKTINTEEVYQTDYQSHEEVARSVVDYIERFYNANLLHSSLGYHSPDRIRKNVRFKNHHRAT